MPNQSQAKASLTPEDRTTIAADRVPAHAVTLRAGTSRPVSRRHVPIACARLVTLADLVVILAALTAVLVVPNLSRMPLGFAGFLAIRVTVKNLLLGAFVVTACYAVFHLVGLYDATRLRGWWEETRRAVAAVVLITPVAALFPLTSRSAALHMSSIAAFSLVALALMVGARTARAAVAGRHRQRCRVLIVGTGPQALRIHRELCADARDYLVLGFVDTGREAVSPFLARRTLGGLDDLERILVVEHIDEVRIGLPVKSRYLEIAETLRTCERIGVKAAYHADIFDTEIAWPKLHSSDALPLVEMHVAPDDWRLGVKRIVDIGGALAALVLLSPLMLAIAVLVKATSRGPVIYAQERYGLNRRRFRMLKFRTMVPNADVLQAALEPRNEADGPVFKIARDPRVTPLGRILRKTSLDELPQLLNVLRGEMSLVGPRPLPLRDVQRFTRAADMRRFSVRPGLTCLWQISGRSGIGFDEWVRLDLQYIDGWSLALDAWVLIKTIPAVVAGRGAA